MFVIFHISTAQVIINTTVFRSIFTVFTIIVFSSKDLFHLKNVTITLDEAVADGSRIRRETTRKSRTQNFWCYFPNLNAISHISAAVASGFWARSARSLPSRSLSRSESWGRDTWTFIKGSPIRFNENCSHRRTEKSCAYSFIS